nr:FeoA family protein [Fusibacter paucivorans]
MESAAIGETYTINSIETTDSEMKHFLFTLGCFEGERVTLVSVLSDLYVISVKDARYSIDRELASAIGID